MSKYLILSGMLLLNIVASYQKANAQSYPIVYRFEMSSPNGTIQTFGVNGEKVITRTLSDIGENTHLSERFILKQKGGYVYIASAKDQRLFLKREGYSVVLSELNNISAPSNAFRWKILYAGDQKACIASFNLGQLLKLDTAGKLRMIPYANGKYGNIKFTLTKETKNL